MRFSPKKILKKIQRYWNFILRLNFIILKLNIHFCTSIFFSFHSNFDHQWELQTSKTEKQMCSQFYLIKNCILIHQRNFFMLILKAVNQLTKNVYTMVHKFIIICNEVHIFQNTNTTFAKCRKTKKTYLHKKAHLIKKILKFHWQKKKKRKHSAFFDDENADPSKKIK